MQLKCGITFIFNNLAHCLLCLSPAQIFPELKRFRPSRHYLTGKNLERLVTDQQPKLGQPLIKGLNGDFALQLGAPERRGRTSGEAIKAGLDFLGAHWQNGHWQDSSLPVAGSDAWVTSCVLAR